MPVYLIPKKLVLDSPIKPAPATLRAVLASVFNRDVFDSADYNVDEAETMVVLGHKLLSDLGYEADHIQTIFRHFRPWLEEWGEKLREAVASHGGNKPIVLKPHPVMLSISDNTRAALIYGNNDRTKYFDFTKGEELTTLTGVAPILQIAVNLSQLFESAVDTRGSDWYRLAAKEAVESVS